jgi:hypothetical protein
MPAFPDPEFESVVPSEGLEVPRTGPLVEETDFLLWTSWATRLLVTIFLVGCLVLVVVPEPELPDTTPSIDGGVDAADPL